MTHISTALPAELAAAIAALLYQRPRKALAERAQRLSKGFRDRKTSRETILDADDALAYALSRLPATYAATATVLRKMREEIPDFRPKSLLDLGCGLGAASFAAMETWPEIESVVLLDRSAQFLELAERLIRANSRPALAKAQLVETDMARLGETRGGFDLIVMSYSATELADAHLTQTLAGAWALAAGALVIIEPGTPRDYARLMTVRASLLKAGAHIALPCPHALPCPLEPPDWCHFTARLPRSRDHKLVKDATVPFEDEKFSYLVAARNSQTLPPPQARILQQPHSLKYGISLKLCLMSGIRETTILKGDKAQYGRIRRSSWGDRIDVPSEDGT